MLTQIVTGDALEELDKKLNNCGVKFRLAGAHNGKSKVNGLNGNGESDSGNGKGASLRDLIGSEQKVKMSDIIDACVEDSMEDMKDDSNAKLTHFIPTTDLEEDRYVKHMNYIEGEEKVDKHLYFSDFLWFFDKIWLQMTWISQKYTFL